jgi:hypothetical protein
LRAALARSSSAVKARTSAVRGTLRSAIRRALRSSLKLAWNSDSAVESAVALLLDLSHRNVNRSVSVLFW